MISYRNTEALREVLESPGGENRALDNGGFKSFNEVLECSAANVPDERMKALE